MNKILIGAAATTMMALAPVATTFAWPHTDSVKATCSSITGSFTNQDKNSVTIVMKTVYGDSSSHVVRPNQTRTFVVNVPAQTTSVADGKVTFQETAPSRDSDTASYTGVKDCNQTTTPPTTTTPGTGGDTPTTPTTSTTPTTTPTTTTAPAPQVVTKPTGSVNAGSAAVAPAGIVAGLTALVAGFGLGLRRFGRSVR